MESQNKLSIAEFAQTIGFFVDYLDKFCFLRVLLVKQL